MSKFLKNSLILRKIFLNMQTLSHEEKLLNLNAKIINLNIPKTESEWNNRLQQKDFNIGQRSNFIYKYSILEIAKKNTNSPIWNGQTKWTCSSWKISKWLLNIWVLNFTYKKFLKINVFYF